LLIEYKVGDKVIIDIDPSEHNTMPHRRFQGRVGIVEDVGRRILRVMVKFGDKPKYLQTKLNHVRPLTKNT